MSVDFQQNMVHLITTAVRSSDPTCNYLMTHHPRYFGHRISNEAIHLQEYPDMSLTERVSVVGTLGTRIREVFGSNLGPRSRYLD
jgi:hypothetical protein